MAAYRDDLRSLEVRADELREELSAIRARTRELEHLRAREASVCRELAENEARLQRFPERCGMACRKGSRSRGVVASVLVLLLAGAGAARAALVPRAETPLARSGIPSVSASFESIDSSPQTPHESSAETVVLTVSASPPDAELSLDGGRIGNPFTGEISKGRHRVTAKARGHISRTRYLDLREDAVLDFQLRTEMKPGELALRARH